MRGATPFPESLPLDLLYFVGRQKKVFNCDFSSVALSVCACCGNATSTVTNLSFPLSQQESAGGMLGYWLHGVSGRSEGLSASSEIGSIYIRMC